MNIIYARNPGYGFVSTPSDAVVRELEKLGHTIVWTDNVDFIPPKKYDFVISFYEATTLLGDVISKKFNIPHYAHIEWLPPWRAVATCNPREYGYTGNEEELKHAQDMQKHYLLVGKTWLAAKIKSLGGKAFFDYHSKLLQSDLSDVIVRLPSIDVETCLLAKQMYSPKQIPNRIITISRLVPNKRYDILLDIVNRIQQKVEWVIVGDGPEKEKVQKSFNNENVTLTFLGAEWGWTRLYELSKSALYLGSWTGMPPIEAALLGCYPIIIDAPKTQEINDSILKELFRGYINVCDPKNIPETMKIVEQTIASTPDDKKEKCEKLVKSFLNNELGVTTAEQNAKNLEEHLNNG